MVCTTLLKGTHLTSFSMTASRMAATKPVDIFNTLVSNVFFIADKKFASVKASTKLAKPTNFEFKTPFPGI